jgi:TRAP-type uncharacterized transport system fused permease subunit
VVALAAATINWFSGLVSRSERLLAFAGAYLVRTPEFWLNLSGLAAA